MKIVGEPDETSRLSFNILLEKEMPWIFRLEM